MWFYSSTLLQDTRRELTSYIQPESLAAAFLTQALVLKCLHCNAVLGRHAQKKQFLQSVRSTCSSWCPPGTPIPYPWPRKWGCTVPLGIRAQSELISELWLFIYTLPSNSVSEELVCFSNASFPKMLLSHPAHVTLVSQEFSWATSLLHAAARTLWYGL